MQQLLQYNVTVSTLRRLGELPLRAGDLLVLATGDDFAERKNLSRNFILLSDSLDVRLMDSKAGFLATAALVAVIVMAALGAIPLSLGLLLLLVGFWAADVVSVDDLRRRFPFDIWILVSSALVVADAMIETQLVASLVGSVMPFLSGSSPFLGLVIVFVITLILTELITNNAAAALMFPIGYALAEASGADVMPFRTCGGICGKWLVSDALRLRDQSHRAKHRRLYPWRLFALWLSYYACLYRWRIGNAAYDILCTSVRDLYCRCAER